MALLTVPDLTVQTKYFFGKIYVTLFKHKDFKMMCVLCKSQNTMEECV